MSVKMSSVACDAQASTQQSNAPNQMKKPSVLIVVDRTHLCTKDVLPIKTQLLKQKSENKISSTQQSQQPEMLNPNSFITAINIIVLIAEVLSQIRSTFNTISYSDIINVVSINSRRNFGKNIAGQKVHGSYNNANNNSAIVPTQKVLTNSHQFSRHG